MVIWGHFFNQMGVAVYMHINLEHLGFITFLCIQLCVHTLVINTNFLMHTGDYYTQIYNLSKTHFDK